MEKVNRRRPRINTTIAPYTLAVVVMVAKEQVIRAYGPTLDYIVADWVSLKHLVIETAASSAVLEETK